MDDRVHHPQHHVAPEHGVTSFMARVRTVHEEGGSPPAVRVVTCGPRSLADANDEWVAQRAFAEQVVSEVNAVVGKDDRLSLDDELGGGSLAFVVRGVIGGVRIRMRHDGGLAWLSCTLTDGAPPRPGLASLADEGVELADPVALEDIALHLVALNAPQP